VLGDFKTKVAAHRFTLLTWRSEPADDPSGAWSRSQCAAVGADREHTQVLPGVPFSAGNRLGRVINYRSNPRGEIRWLEIFSKKN
jgi:hypothetical protein